ncbi:MAG: TrkA family potassium uptake protein [Oscillospiraceae bacterium]
MNILVIGCGKVGSRLALELDRQGHDVFVIDANENNFEPLSKDFTGFTEVGIPIDLDVLKKAGIESCDAVAAVTQDDNINIMTSQLAREIFKIPIVITRIFDPKREDVFSHFGLHTICPTNLTVEAACFALTQAENARNLTFGTSTISFVTRKIIPELIGENLSNIEIDEINEGEYLYAVLKASGSVVVYGSGDYILSPGDKFIFSKVVD